MQCSFSFAILCFSNKLSYLGRKVAYVMPLHPFIIEILLLILLTISSTIQVWCQFGEFGFGSINNPQIDVFIFSYHISV